MAPSTVVDGGVVGAEMERDGAEMEQLFERGREQMLAVVLLHVVEPPDPVDLALHGVAVERPRKQVPDGPVVIGLDVHHGYRIELPVVSRLAAAFGVEGRPVEGHGRVSFPIRPGDDGGGEGGEVGVGEVEPVGHGEER
jgi:hypothetical protein